MTKEEVQKKIKAILSKDPRYKNAKVIVKFTDKKNKKETTTKPEKT